MPNAAAMRLKDWQRSKSVTVLVDGAPMQAYAGEMLAAAMLTAGIVSLRKSPQGKTARGAFCLMGVCQECLVRVDGQTRQACLVSIVDGLSVQLAAPYEAAYDAGV